MNTKVLMIDDEFLKQEAFRINAEAEGVDVLLCKSHEEGIKTFEQTPTLFDAVILDAKVYSRAHDTVATIEGLAQSIKYFHEVAPGVRPQVFVFTGAPDYMKQEMFSQMLKGFGISRYYRKGHDEDLLLKDIKDAVNNKVSHKIKSLYPHIFHALEDLSLSATAQQDFLVILKAIHFPVEIIRPEHFYNRLRLVVEQLMHVTREHGLLHPECIRNGKVNVRNSFTFLAGDFTNLGPLFARNNGPVLPEVLRTNLPNILDILNAGSHWDNPDENDRSLHLPKYHESINTPHLLFACTFFMMDLIMWIQQNSNRRSQNEGDSNTWEEIQKKGTIMDNGKEYSCGKFLLKKPLKNNCRAGSKIKIFLAVPNRNYPGKSDFPLLAKDYKPA